MNISPVNLILTISLLIIASYIIDVISKLFKMPAVILLISVGVILKYITGYFNLSIIFPAERLELLGTLGLILIVLEGSLDLKLTKEKLPRMKEAFISALILLVTSSLLTSIFLNAIFSVGLKNSFINAIPFCVLSSSIALPMLSTLNSCIKEFITYEATFSDILGIFLFNYMLQETPFSLSGFSTFGISLILIVLLSIILAISLIFLIGKIKHHIKFFLILSVLLVVYCLGKIFHLPSLLLVIVFGLMLNNINKIIPDSLKTFFARDKINSELNGFKVITSEVTFVVRTFFFILFGFTLDISSLVNTQTIIIGISIVFIGMLLRFIYLYFRVQQQDQLKKLFLAPRGLITILLFYSIPPEHSVPGLSQNIILVVVLSTVLLTSISLWIGEKKPAHDIIEDKIITESSKIEG